MRAVNYCLHFRHAALWMSSAGKTDGFRESRTHVTPGERNRVRKEVEMSARLTTVRVGLPRIAVCLLVLSACGLPLVRAAHAQETITVAIPTVSGEPGDSVEMAVFLHTKGEDVAGIQIDVEADAPLSFPITEANAPDCWRNEELTKDYTVYSFPLRFEGQWNRMRSLVLSLTNVDPIPDGALLFTCRVQIAADADPGEYHLFPLRLAGSTRRGEPIPADATGGTVIVADAAEDSVPLNPEAGQASGGCAIDTTAAASSAWLLLAPALLVVRRRLHR